MFLFVFIIVLVSTEYLFELHRDILNASGIVEKELEGSQICE